MSELLTIDDLLEHVDRAELDQVAGIGSHNAVDGRRLDEAKIGAAIKFAGDMVRGYLQRRYPIIMEMDPEQTPDLLQGYLSDIVRYRLRGRTDNRNTTTDEVSQRFKDAKEWLREVSRGLVNVDLSDVDGGASAESKGAVNPGGKIHTHSTPTRARAILDGYLP
jgi:phage gp36-like protein